MTDALADTKAMLDARRALALTNGARGGPGGGSNGAAPYEELLELNAKRGCPGDSILDTPELVESRWGTGHQCAWAKGEPTMLVGPDGVGKTSVAQQATLSMAGVLAPSLLGFDVKPADRVLYLACDRPSQAGRSMRRMVSEADRLLLHERLVVWRGPLPFDLAGEPAALLAMAKHYGADVVVLDSLKDVAADLSREETGQGLNRAFQGCVADEVDVLALHHQRKAQNGAGKPNRLSDVYGSRWLTAGCGSVLMLWGEAGDPVVELTHLKQPDEPVGPFHVVHDHVAGRTTAADHPDAYSVVMSSTKGVTAAEVAKALFGTGDQNSQEKVRRKLDPLVREGKVHKEEGAARGGPGGREPARYYPVDLYHQGGDEGE